MMTESILKALQFYSFSLIQLLIEPGLFFRELAHKKTMKRATGFMVICSIFFAGASLLTGVYSKSVFQMAIIYFVNAAGMILISSILGYTAMVMILRKRFSFPIVFSLYAYASGLTLFFIMVTFFVMAYRTVEMVADIHRIEECLQTQMETGLDNTGGVHNGSVFAHIFSHDRIC